MKPPIKLNSQGEPRAFSLHELALEQAARNCNPDYEPWSLSTEELEVLGGIQRPPDSDEESR